MRRFGEEDVLGILARLFCRELRGEVALIGLQAIVLARQAVVVGAFVAEDAFALARLRARFLQFDFLAPLCFIERDHGLLALDFQFRDIFLEILEILVFSDPGFMAHLQQRHQRFHVAGDTIIDRGNLRPWQGIVIT